MPGEKTPLVGFAGEGGPKQKDRRGITCLLIVLILLLLVFIAVAVTFITLYVINERMTTVALTATEPCITSTCISLTQEILGSIDESVHPCDDFYNFACGGWKWTHALEPGMYLPARSCSVWYSMVRFWHTNNYRIHRDICPMTDGYNCLCTVCTTLPDPLDPSHHDEKLGLAGQTSTTHDATDSLIQHSALILSW